MMESGTVMSIGPPRTARSRAGDRWSSRVLGGLAGAVAGAAFAASVGRAPWLVLVGLALLAVAALLGGYDSRDEGSWRPPTRH